jgi:hypothetical protein
LYRSFQCSFKLFVNRAAAFTATQLRGVLKTRAKNKRDDGGLDGAASASKSPGKRGRKPDLAA